MLDWSIIFCTLEGRYAIAAEAMGEFAEQIPVPIPVLWQLVAGISNTPKGHNNDRTTQVCAWSNKYLIVASMGKTNQVGNKKREVVYTRNPP